MDQLISKYKISISVISMLALLGWVWIVASTLTAKEDQIKHRLDVIEFTKLNNEAKIASNHDRINRCNSLNNEVSNNVKLIGKDVDYIRGRIEKLWSHYDDDHVRIDK